MGSACQKQSLEMQHSDQSDEPLELIQPVSKEITVSRIHHTHQKIKHKHKLASLSKVSEIKSIHLIEQDIHLNQSTRMHKSTQEQSLLLVTKEQVQKNKEQKPKNINQVLLQSKSKDQIQEQQIRSSLRSISLQHTISNSHIPVRGQSEKHVRFKLPKQSKKNIKSEKQIKRHKTRIDDPLFLDKFNLKSRLLQL